MRALEMAFSTKGIEQSYAETSDSMVEIAGSTQQQHSRSAFAPFG